MPAPSPRHHVLYRHPARVALATLLAASVGVVSATEAKEKPRMSEHAAHVTATQALQGMLELIRKTPAVGALTPEAMAERLGFPVKRHGPDDFGYAQALAGGWAFSVQRQAVASVGPRVDLIFEPVAEDDTPSPEPICTPDFSHFTQELERMGFKRQRTHGEHGRWTYDAFDRAGQHVEVYPLVDAGSREGDATRTCVSMVLVR
ncbi:hypothetical protein KPL74_12375 [Bacillus sp. NP157]|nr:hypothetical protein KPL74_12375 [Bacillus sp. NP157]